MRKILIKKFKPSFWGRGVVKDHSSVPTIRRGYSVKDHSSVPTVHRNGVTDHSSVPTIRKGALS
jgi:hypothetical protein